MRLLPKPNSSAVQSWAGFKNNIPGAKSFSAGLIVPVDPHTPGGPWRPAGPDLACDGDCRGKGLGWAPENPVAMLATDKKHYYAVYDPLHDQGPGDDIGVAWSADGVCAHLLRPLRVCRLLFGVVT